ncbi:MAG: non-canonical purine NTP pyrophosphatase [Deltaproteobacteria bacterium]|nr:MAG: non-canonical purine NTP pyrophosphatase [Deltaproteobacteria bacterium]
MADLIVATGNAKKIEEIRRVLEGTGWRLRTPAELGIEMDVEEDGETFVGNAVRKALAWSKASGLPALADDSGLEVDALAGAPGVHSSRYAGEDATDARNNEKLLEALSGVDEADRSARFRCVLAFAQRLRGEPGEALELDRIPVPGDVRVLHREKVYRVRTFAGSFEGRIGAAGRGDGGFGYDPIFVAGDGRSLAEWDPEEKAQHSHRGRALHAFEEAVRGEAFVR